MVRNSRRAGGRSILDEMRVLALIITTSSLGCGLTMTTGPDPRQPPAERPRCTESMAAPQRDGIGAVIGLVAVVFGAVALEADNETVGAPLLIGGLVTMAASYASGGIGYFRVKRCRRAVEDFNRRAMPAGTNATAPGLGVSDG